jgi:dolichyl-phosphate-mannose-protein mannosyltransferase
VTESAGGRRSAREALAVVLRWLVVAGSGGCLATYLAIAFLRIGYPFELEWLEGGSLEHVARLLRGQALYVAPGPEFVPFPYPPLYYVLAAVVAKLTGPGFFALRAVSFASSMACFLAIYALVWHETQDRFAAWVASGLFAATFRAGGAWLDLARVDSLFLALFLLGLVAMCRHPSAAGYATAGVLFALSSLTKQTALAMCLPVLLFAALSAPRRAAWLGSALGLVAGAATAALLWTSGGWYGYYVFRLPFLFEWARPVFVDFWTDDLLRPLPIAATAAAVTLVGLLRTRDRSLFWLTVAIGMVGGAYRSRLQTGGYDNVLLPAYAVICILFGLGVGIVLDLARRLADGRPVAEIAVYLGCLAQMAALAYDPRAAVPSARDRRAGEAIVRFLASVDGDVFVPFHGYLARLAGKASWAHEMSVLDVLRVERPEAGPLAEAHRAAIRERRFGAIVIDEPDGYAFMPEIEASYLRTRDLFADPDVFFPVTGTRTRPQHVYVPRGALARPEADVRVPGR